MKKKLEAELISIAHRILKLKNRAELDQLQQETLKLYEKISVLRFVEDNFSGTKPTIGYASAEEKLEEIYGIEETAPVHANEVEVIEDKARQEKAEAKSEEQEEAPKEETEKDTTEKEVKAEEQTETPEAGEEKAAEGQEEPADEQAPAATEAKKDEAPAEEEKEEEPAVEKKIEVIKPEEDVKAMETSAAEVYDKEDGSTPEEEEQAADAEVITIEPDAATKTEDTKLNFEFAFDRSAAPEEPVKQKEISFEDYHDYKEPEFVKKGEEPKAETQPDDTQKEEPVRDWRNWEPTKSEPKEEAPKTEAPKPAGEVKQAPQAQQPASIAADAPAARSLNDALGKTINIGLNDRIAFEKNLFGGSGEDLNRVLSQLNTFNSFADAQNFINDLVKPDYNNWQGKEEYEERFMELVEKRFS